MTDRRIVFHSKHLEVMDVRPLDKQSVLALDAVRYVLEKMEGQNDAITLMYDGRIIACMGFWNLLPGVAEVWLIPSVYVKTVPKFFVREVNRYLTQVAETCAWHRAQTVTRSDLFHRRWMKALGFVEEGVMKQYHEKQDYIMSARYFTPG